MQIVISANTSWYIYNFRLSLIKKIISNGQQVVVIAKNDNYTEKLIDNGVQFFPIEIDNDGINPFNELKLIYRYYNVLKDLSPLLFLGYTIKPNIYGSLICFILKIPSVLNISGLGTVFVKKTFLTWIMNMLYYLCLRSAKIIFFQNSDDYNYFVSSGLAPVDKSDLLPGSGVDLKRFKPVRKNKKIIDHPVRFLLLGRLIAEKGIYEFINAGQILKKKGYNIELQLLGFLNDGKRRAIKKSELKEWITKKYVTYFSPVDDVRQYISRADCIVLPTYYREGVPRSLLEAASMGKIIITTDVSGARDAVDDKSTGYICKVKDSLDLASKMQKIIELSPQKRIKMSINARKKMERQFDEKIVIDKYMQIIKTII